MCFTYTTLGKVRLQNQTPRSLNLDPLKRNFLGKRRPCAQAVPQLALRRAVPRRRISLTEVVPRFRADLFSQCSASSLSSSPSPRECLSTPAHQSPLSMLALR